MRRRPIAGLVLVIAGASLLLAGCAAPTDSPTSSRTSSATPTPTAAAAPGSRVPISCASLYTPATVKPLVGAPVSVVRDESTKPGSFAELANAQLGTLSCEWGGGDDFEAGWTADLAVSIAPDSAASFAAHYTANLAEGPADAGTPIENTVGDKSEYRCTAEGRAGDSPLCYAEMLVGTYWVSAEFEALSPATVETAGASTQALMSAVSAKLTAAGQPKSRVWAAPASTPPNFCSNPGSSATVRSITGEPTLALFPLGTPSRDAGNIALEGRDASCAWSSETDRAVDIELLAGGSWAFPGYTPVLADSIVHSVSPVTVPGTTGAVLGCDEGACLAVFALGATAVRILLDDLGSQAKDVAAVAAFAKAISAS